MEEKIYILLLDYVDDKICERDIQVIGVYKTLEKAKDCLKKWKDGLLNGGSWESNAYKQYQENVSNSGYDVFEDDKSFEIYEDGNYDINHTSCRIMVNKIID